MDLWRIIDFEFYGEFCWCFCGMVYDRMLWIVGDEEMWCCIIVSRDGLVNIFFILQVLLVDIMDMLLKCGNDISFLLILCIIWDGLVELGMKFFRKMKGFFRF